MIPTRIALLARVRSGPVLLTLLLLSAGAAAQDASPWVKGPSSSARLITAGGLQGDRSYLSGIEIKLVGNAHTYWRTPGDSGVPPTASFEGSRNLARAELAFPAPTRLQEAGADVFGYRESVILPLKVVPQDPTQPVQLALDLRYAACDKICIPAEAQAQLTLTPDLASTPMAGVLKDAATKVPRALESGGPTVQVARRDAKTWSVAIEPMPPGADLFAESPDNWFFETQARTKGFDVVLAEHPAEGGQVPVTFTLTSPQGAWEFSMKLDVARTTP